MLLHHFLQTTPLEQGIKPKDISKEAVEILTQYDWPGNVRELKNIVERLLILFPGPTIDAKDLSAFLGWEPPAQLSPDVPPFTSLKEARAFFEKAYITQKLKEHHGNIQKTAESLKIDRSHLHRKLKVLDIDTEP